MESYLFFALIVGTLLVSSETLSCIQCSHTPGTYEDTNCRDGKSTTKVTDSNKTACIVTGYFNGTTKALLQLSRGSSEPASAVPLANQPCFTLPGSSDQSQYIYCVCDTNDCNDYVINNCKCEKPTKSGVNHVHPKAILIGGIALVAVLMRLF